jgi:hypothetical protein
MGYNRSTDYIYEYKQRYMKELGKYPDSKAKAKIFIGSRIGSLRKQLKNETRPRYRQVIKKIILIYEEAR